MLERPVHEARSRRRAARSGQEPEIEVRRTVGRDIVGTRPVAAITAAVWAAAVGLVVIGALVVLGWAVSGRGDDGIGTALAATGVVWLVAHHAPVATEAGATITLLPLALTALPLLVLHRAGRWAARITATTTPADTALLVTAAVATYAGIAVGVAQISSIGTAEVPDLAALGWAALVGAIGLGWGAASWAGLLAPLPDRLPASLRRAALVGSVSAAALVVAAGAVSVVALVARWSTVTGLERQVAPGALEAVELLLVSIAYLPNLLLWSLSYLAGPGFAAGGGATVDPFSASGALLPGIPIFGAIPVDAPPAAPLLLLLPVLAGVLGALALRRRGPLTLATEAGAVVLGALGVGAAAGVAGALASGALGSARLAQLGPHALLMGVALAGLVAAGGLLVCLVSRASSNLLPTLWVHEGS
jgi:hypothetical protein